MVELEYAKALYNLALEENKIDLFSECFTAVNETIKNKEFYDVITSPTIDKISKKEVIKGVYKSLDSTFVNFLQVIIDHNRASILNRIYNEYNNLVLADKNITKIDVISASVLTNPQLKSIEEALVERYKGKKLEINNIVNPELIGGIQVLSNGESLDISLKSCLDKLKESL